jgi:hypothetical protein
MMLQVALWGMTTAKTLELMQLHRFGVWVWGLGFGVWDLIPANSLPVLVGRGTFTWSNISRGTGKGGGREGVMMNAALMRDGQA